MHGAAAFLRPLLLDVEQQQLDFILVADGSARSAAVLAACRGRLEATEERRRGGKRTRRTEEHGLGE